ncbi:MAG: putative manganese transporter [Ignavibacteriaceae bacterium]
MKSILLNVIEDTVQITLLVTVMMILVDLINVWTKGKIEAFLKGKAKGTQYVVASLIGTVPGCVGGFTNVSLYLHGLISFGALSGSMISVSGDEAFVMLALFPKWAMILFAVLFVAVGLKYIHLKEFTSQYKIAFLFLGALIGLFPESGPHLIFVSLFAKGLVSFSVLLTSSMV